MVDKRSKRHRSDWPSPTQPTLPKLGTEAARDYYMTYATIEGFAAYVLLMAGQIAHFSETARKALLDTAGTQEERERYAKDRGPHPALVELAFHRQIFIELMLVRHVENYLNYLASLLFEILVARPEALRSQEKVDLEFIIGHGSMDSLIRGLAERRVDSLSYSSFSALVDYFDDRFSLSICAEDQRSIVAEAIETRNISVHNRCVINNRYLERTGRDSKLLGRRRTLSTEYMAKLLPVLLDSTKELDKAARRRLKVRGCRFNIPELVKEERQARREGLAKQLSRNQAG